MVEELTSPRTVGYVKSVARKFVRAHDVEDVVQETMLHAFMNLHRYQPGNFRAWLGRIAYNYICSVQRRPRIVTYRDIQDSEHPVAPKLDDGLSQELQWALDDLSDVSRRILLNVMCGMTAAECAEEMDLSVQAVRMKLHRARKQICGTLEMED